MIIKLNIKIIILTNKKPLIYKKLYTILNYFTYYFINILKYQNLNIKFI
jgi:hypothetical protein